MTMYLCQNTLSCCVATCTAFLCFNKDTEPTRWPVTLFIHRQSSQVYFSMLKWSVRVEWEWLVLICCYLHEHAPFATISIWQVQQRKASLKPSSRDVCHICSILMLSNHAHLNMGCLFILTNWKKKLSTLGLKWIEECDSKSLCSPCAMLYHWLYKGFIIDQLAPSSGSYGEWSAAQRHCTTTFFNAEVSPAGPPGVLPLLLQGGQCTEAWWCQL